MVLYEDWPNHNLKNRPLTKLAFYQIYDSSNQLLTKLTFDRIYALLNHYQKLNIGQIFFDELFMSNDIY